MAEGFQGTGYPDPVTGEWIDTSGMTVNNTAQSPAPQWRPITSPPSSSGEPLFKDPSASEWTPEFAPPPSGGQLTPSSRFGTPAPGIRTLPATYRPIPGAPNAATMPGLPFGGGLLTGIGALAGAPTTDQGVYDNANAIGQAVDSNPLVALAIKYGWLSPSPKWGPAPATQTGSIPLNTVPGRPIPVTEPSSQRPPPIPPSGGSPLPPPRPPGPFVRGPLPVSPTIGGARAPAIQARPSGAAAPPAPSMVNLQPIQPPGHWEATTGNARGNPTWIPGVYGTPANPAPQIFRGQTTAWGAPLQGQGPIGAQNYYTAGSAPVAPGDWIGTQGVAGPLAAPVNAGGNARSGRTSAPAPAPAPQQTRVARAPAMQRKGFNAGKFLGNPANYQYPNIPF